MLGAAAALLILQQVKVSDLGGSLKVAVGAGVLLVFLVFCAAMVISLWPTSRSKNREAAIWIIAGVLVASPFLLIGPFGPRNFYVTVACFLVGVFIVLAPTLNRLGRVRYAATTILVMVSIAASSLMGVMAVNKVVDVKNKISAEQQKSAGEEEIHLRSYPFTSLIHRALEGKAYAVSLQEYSCDEERICKVTKRVKVVFE
ncbi:hypothetical protein G7066_13350 [Leucobacter coleopterorum]|uniref:Uncharacterized protein n=1 Tax=Leucobacter coleopterorum TaxID=2714933 RepID=A0ABX6JYL2_9MICO|nr:hypothetical protein [Leucobacter coleopterorum]QIM19308.1 hypothetical protein G7066_13350 [Leucobacter coleopterorum]